MIKLLFSLDYEVYGSGQGSFENQMIKPTSELLRIFDRYGAKLTIMAEVAEILSIKNSDRYIETVRHIENQLQYAIKNGHDVQLHLHPAWFNAKENNGSWDLNLSNYALAKMDIREIRKFLRIGKDYLETTCKAVNKDYSCVAFRAGNWIMQPSKNIVSALEKENIWYDTSVYKYGVGTLGEYQIDYRDAHSNLIPWTVDPEDINKKSERKGLQEIPIFTMRKSIFQMLTLKRISTHLKTLKGCKNDDRSSSEDKGSGKSLNKLSLYMPKKFDFTRLNYKEMIEFVNSSKKLAEGSDRPVPVVAIGHSTEFHNGRDIELFLDYTKSHNIEWTTFSEIYRNDYNYNKVISQCKSD